jgi:PHD/YefM family antitoxin component YafN of YafNO toxin-antitoxin module
MSPIPLIPQQFPAVDVRDADRPRVVDPRTNEVYVLVSEADFESVQGLLEEERQFRTIHAIGRRNAAGRMGSDCEPV